MNTLGCIVLKFWPNIFLKKPSLGQVCKFVQRGIKFYRIDPRVFTCALNPCPFFSILRLALRTLQMAVCKAVSLNPLVNHPFFITAVTLEGGDSRSWINKHLWRPKKSYFYIEQECNPKSQHLQAKLRRNPIFFYPISRRRGWVSTSENQTYCASLSCFGHLRAAKNIFTYKNDLG